MKETELAEAVIAWLEEQHWDVYQEVQVYSLGSIADIVAVRGPIVYVIECKTSLTLTVLDQARRWRSHLRSVAVPKRKQKRYRSHDRDSAYDIASRFYEIGVLEVSKHTSFDESVETWDVDEVVRPKLKRDFHLSSQRIRETLLPGHKTHKKAGSPSVGGHWTPYKSTINLVKRFIKNNPGCTFREIGDDLGKMHYSSIASAIGNLRAALMNWESHWCRVDMDSKPYRCYIKEGA